jgi:hypothetical protein
MYSNLVKFEVVTSNVCQSYKNEKKLTFQPDALNIQALANTQAEVCNQGSVLLECWEKVPCPILT